jgi:hypothetical protein
MQRLQHSYTVLFCGGWNWLSHMSFGSKKPCTSVLDMSLRTFPLHMSYVAADRALGEQPGHHEVQREREPLCHPCPGLIVPGRVKPVPCL